MSPKKWILGERLQSARLALTRPCASSITVTGVATDYGFYELGRFAANYREAFGEAPSDTLRDAGRKAKGTQASRRGQIDASPNWQNRSQRSGHSLALDFDATPGAI
jgi:AraC-like DNA-binding protein